MQRDSLLDHTAKTHFDMSYPLPNEISKAAGRALNALAVISRKEFPPKVHAKILVSMTCVRLSAERIYLQSPSRDCLR